MTQTELKDYWSNPDEVDPSEVKTAIFKRVGKGDTEGRIAERIRDYEKDFDTTSLTVADRNQIKNLARLEVGIEALTDKISQIGESSPKDTKSLSDTLSVMMTQHRQLASALGIDRKSRANRGESEYEEYLPRLHHEAYEFLSKQAIVIMCLKCARSKSHTKINEGVIIFTFADNVKWSWDSSCPKCKESLHIDQDNWHNYTRYAIDRIEDATSEEINSD
jgi:hypothetical protein